MKSSLQVVFFILLANLALAQNSERPWLIGISTNYADFYAVEMSVQKQLTDANWMGKTLPSQLKIARLLNKSFSIGAEFSYITLEGEKLNRMPVRSTMTTDKMWRIGGQLEYRIANGYLLKENARFDPYIFAGFNGSNINEKTYLVQSTGVGANLWILPWMGLNFEGSYDYLFDWNDYFHYSLGLSFRIGKGNDRDGDGIADNQDDCPDVPGIKSLRGCPDTDGDGIADHLDRCPKQAGLAQLNGCPDRDNDGIADNEDDCPDVPGLAQFKGCPDRDGDGIPDRLDECPDVAGLANLKGCPDRDGDGIPDHRDDCPDVAGLTALNGCPDSDGDGIPDHLDKCPNEKGTRANNGCPDIIEHTERIDFHAKNILFETNSAFIRPESHKDLDEIAEIMKKFPNAKFSVYGYTDSTGPVDYNLRLSRDRARSVANYLTRKGVNRDQLVVEGFGIQNPVDTNATPEGRQNNRRVEIKLIK